MNLVRLAACIVALSLGGCSTQLGDSPGEGGGALSQPDATPASPADARPSTSPADAAPPPPDATPVSGNPDAAPADLCTAGYGDVPGYLLCTATVNACVFIALNDGTSCSQHCAARGGTCISAVDNKVGSCTELEPDQTGIGCDTTGKTDLLCTCTVP